MEYKVFKLNIKPADFLQALKDQPQVFLLESSLSHKDRGRYSFLGYDPFLISAGEDLDAFARLQKDVERFKVREKSPLTPFPAGVMGYLSYDFGLRFENLHSHHSAKFSIPEFQFGFYDRIITIDHFKKQVTISSSGWPEKSSRQRRQRALKRIEEVEPILKAAAETTVKVEKALPGPTLKSQMTKAAYCRSVEQALEHIRQGDIYQVNIAQEFSCESIKNLDSVRLYRTLQELSPSCYGGYLNTGRFQIISSSPELFLTLQNGKAETRPMKGTRPRGLTHIADEGQRQELWQNPKEKAELLMVTDLERNDLGRVCEFGSVKVKSIREIEKYRTVFQATATVTGKLQKDKNGFDLLKACFPGGSVTGCPKIRAMRIIDQLESSRRGLYTGAMGYLSFTGDLAFNVLIRTILINETRVSFHVGSGIVADSDPELEYDETLIKAQAMRKSLGLI